jgi:hypothetical protein
MKTIKTEEVYLGGYETFTDVIHALPHFIDARTRTNLHAGIAGSDNRNYRGQSAGLHILWCEQLNVRYGSKADMAFCAANVCC